MNHSFYRNYIDFFDLAKEARDDRDLIKSDFLLNMSMFLVKGCNFPYDSSRAIAEMVFARMASNSLHYHTPVHVLAMFQFYDYELSSKVLLSDDQELAIWFHDAIYVPGRTDNEKRSIELMNLVLEPFVTTEKQQELLDLAAVHIHATARHFDSVVFQEPTNLLLDLDLNSFALDRPQYELVGDCIRREFKETSDEDYKKGRAKFLGHLKNRESLFRTEIVRELFEAKAQQNIKEDYETQT